METKFNFKSQPTTSIEQSNRLLSLGLKKETADCYLFEYDKEKYKVIAESWSGLIADEKHYSQYKDVCFPAWSLDRLRELIPENIFTGVRNQWHRVMYNGILTYEEGDDSLVIFREANIYDRCISCIEWLIKEGILDKDYLEMGTFLRSKI